MLWLLKTGARWQDLPERYPPDQTCHRRYQQWVHRGVFDQVLLALADDCRARGHLDLAEGFAEGFIDGTLVIATNGGLGWAQPSGGKVPTSWSWEIARVFLSPSPGPVLRRLKRRSSSPPSPAPSRRRSPRAGVATAPTTRIPWMPSWRPGGLS